MRHYFDSEVIAIDDDPEIIISSCQVPPPVVEKLLSSRLTVLSLAYCNLGLSFCEIWNQCNTLARSIEKLALSGNPIPNAGINIILQKKCPCLEILELQHVSSSLMECIFDEAEFAPTCHVNLECNNIYGEEVFLRNGVVLHLSTITFESGIHALEVCLPQYSCKAAELEKMHNVDGKYTKGMLMNAFCGPGTNEDPTSLALTALKRLLRFVNAQEIGMLTVGTESTVDRHVSIQFELVRFLAEEYGNTSVRGGEVYNACYGGTAAMFTCLDWIQSPFWDGRYAVFVCADIADPPAEYPFLVGGAAVAILLGRHAPVVVDAIRGTHIANHWDFYKPIGWKHMAPIVDGPGSVQVYQNCLQRCLELYTDKHYMVSPLDTAQHCIFHLGAGPKFVKHASEHACKVAYRATTSRKEEEDIFYKKVWPSLSIATEVGPQHTAAVYTNLLSLLLKKGDALKSTSVTIFSYGSGAAASFFKVFVKDLPKIPDNFWERDIVSRVNLTPPEFERVITSYVSTYGNSDWEAKGARKKSFNVQSCVNYERSYVWLDD